MNEDKVRQNTKEQLFILVILGLVSAFISSGFAIWSGSRMETHNATVDAKINELYDNVHTIVDSHIHSQSEVIRLWLKKVEESEEKFKELQQGIVSANELLLKMPAASDAYQSVY